MKFLPRVQSSFRAGGLVPPVSSQDHILQPQYLPSEHSLQSGTVGSQEAALGWGVARTPCATTMGFGLNFLIWKMRQVLSCSQTCDLFLTHLNVHRGTAQWHPSGGRARKAEEGSSRVRDGKGGGSWEYGDHDGKGQCLLAAASCSTWECGPPWLVSNL